MIISKFAQKGELKDTDSTAPKRGSVFIGLMTPYNEHREMRPKASSSVVEYPILIAYPSMYGMLKVCSVNDLHFRISSARVKSSL